MLDGIFDGTIHDQVVQALVQNKEILQLIDTESLSPSRHKKKRGREITRFSTKTNWGKFIADPTVADPYSKNASSFVEDSGYHSLSLFGYVKSTKRRTSLR